MRLISLVLLLASYRVDGLQPVARHPPLLATSSRVAVRCFALSAMTGDDSANGGTSDGELMSELRKALSSLDEGELAASDERVIDGFVDDRKGQVSAFQEDFDRSLEAAQEAIESRLEGELRDVESDFMARVDAAVENLRKSSATGDDTTAAATAAANAAAEGDGIPAASIPAGGLIVVAGAGTPLGTELLRAIGGSESGWQLRALVADGATLNVGDVECESMPFAPFTPTKLARSLAGAAAVIVVSAAAGGTGGVEPEVVPKILKALDANIPPRRLIFVSTHGVERTDKLPYNLRNVFGQLDKQRAAEQEIILKARRMCPAFTIVRFGALKDSPPSASASAGRAQIQPSDVLDGDLPLAAASSLLSKVLLRDEAINATLSAGPAADTASAIGDEAMYWEDEWLKLVGPEVYRRPLTVLPVEDAILWLREWAQRFTRPGQQLTTPVSVQDVDDGVLLRFLTRAGGGYADFDAEETADDKWAAAKPGASKLESGEPDGALLLVAESRPTPRVRVSRAEMAEGTVVKEMSEAAVLAKLDKALTELEKARR
uniref:NAD(P)-binding domain-containing protein n=1 Tax=Haptolina brevifila TaxID=156173 RepID=A0A7S2DV39_9EUKA|mmetsp:Transcript_4426/g.9684  ORF Transcript_4426/g.9684 Transcript_4426/m.9684 type:complete len:548 (+) Transcript_4426:26-1669(+)